MGAHRQSTGRVATIRAMRVRAATWDDLGGAVELIGVQNRAVLGLAGVWVDQVRAGWESREFTVGLDNFVAEDGGRLVGYAAVRPGGELVLAAPDDAVSDALFARALGRARERGEVEIRVTVLSAESPPGRLVMRNSFRLEHETLLMRRPLGEPLDHPAPPDGIAFRTFESGDAATVHSLLDEAYTAWDESYVPMAHGDWVSWMTGDSEFDASVWWLAKREGELVGCALFWNSGWLKDLAVRERERGRGLGAALVGLGLIEFTRRGVRRAGLKVDAANPTGAVRLYERLGFVTASSEAVWVSTL